MIWWYISIRMMNDLWIKKAKIAYCIWVGDLNLRWFFSLIDMVSSSVISRTCSSFQLLHPYNCTYVDILSDICTLFLLAKRQKAIIALLLLLVCFPCCSEITNLFMSVQMAYAAHALVSSCFLQRLGLLNCFSRCICLLDGWRKVP